MAASARVAAWPTRKLPSATAAASSSSAEAVAAPFPLYTAGRSVLASHSSHCSTCEASSDGWSDSPPAVHSVLATISRKRGWAVCPIELKV